VNGAPGYPQYDERDVSHDFRPVSVSLNRLIVSLIVFFIAGLILLSFVDEKKAREAKNAGAF